MERKIFDALYTSTCRTCWKRIEAGMAQYRNPEQPWSARSSTAYLHEKCDPVKEHTHEGFYETHPITQRHRSKVCPELHEAHYGTETPEDPSAVAPVVDLSGIEVRIDGIQEQVTAQQKTLGEHESRIVSKESTRPVVVTINKRKPVDIGVQHMAFSKLFRYAARSRQNVALKGPAGSGKTTAAWSLAKAVGLECLVIPLGPQTSKSDLLGYMSGNGEYVPSLLRKGYDKKGKGAVILFDEMDNCNAAVMPYAHNMIGNGHAGFADRMVERHPDTIIICAMNTWGRGADSLYVGRAKLDAATLNRWVAVEWNYDWDFTRHLTNDHEWTNYVESIADAIDTASVEFVVGPRQAISGAQLLADGEPRKDVEHDVIWAPMPVDDRQKVMAVLNASNGA